VFVLTSFCSEGGTKTKRKKTKTAGKRNIGLVEPCCFLLEDGRRELTCGTPAGTDEQKTRCRIVLAGGGALIKNLDILLREETGLPIMIAEDPLTAVVLGSGKALDQIDILSDVTLR
jgi:hypothetical protein